MSNYADVTFHLQETWRITGTVRDENKAAMDISGGTVTVKAAGVEKIATITSGPSGTYSLDITPAEQRAAEVTAGDHTYEVKAVLADGTETIQSVGKFTVLSSQFAS